MDSGLIEAQEPFEELCRQILETGLAALDTEFVTEDTFQPQLCLLQLATAERSVAVDPFHVERLESLWNLMTDEETTFVVHGGQAEVKFCLAATGRKPRKLVDVQIAEGLQSRSYPLGYEALVQRVLDRRVHGKETRTDWRRRPLSSRQIEYAREDVDYILPIWQRQQESLGRLGRLGWCEVECQRMIDDVEEEYGRKGWQRVSGIHKLRPRELAVARELADWRDEEAARRNKPMRRILRDDLLIELSRRQPKSVKELLETRDMTRPGYRRSADDLLACIRRAVALPDSDLPASSVSRRSGQRHDEQALGQLLNMALANRCAEINVSRQLVGTSADLQHLVRWHVFGKTGGPPPRLLSGWQAEVCGNLLTDLLDGTVTLRVADPKSDYPLVFERRTTDSD